MTSCSACGHAFSHHTSACPRCGAPTAPNQAVAPAPADSPGGRTVSRTQLRRMSDEPDSLSPSGATRLADPPSKGSPQPTAGGLAQTPQWTSSPQAPRASVPLRDPGSARAQPVWAAATDPGDALPAGLGTRFLARLLDSALLTFLFVLIVLVIELIPFGNAGGAIGSVLRLAMVIFAIAYEFVAVGRLGQTVGRRVLGIQVVDQLNGAPIGVGRAVLRVFVFALMGLPFYLGYLSYFFDGSGEHRAWHDKAADDRVVRVPQVTLGRSIRDVLSSMTP